jgi:outer membrane protein assembly factor BamB
MMLKVNLISLISVLLIATITLAKRSGPSEVEPVIYNGIKYVAVQWGQSRGLDQNGGYIEAFDYKTGRQLWLLRIYKINYDAHEKDVQDVFIIKLGIEHGMLLVTNEKNERFTVDLKTRVVTKI